MVSLVELKTAINTSLAPEKMVVQSFSVDVYVYSSEGTSIVTLSAFILICGEHGHGTLFVQQSILKKGLLRFLNMPSKNPSSNIIVRVISLICDNVCMFSVEKVH